jgi:anhydro-N-acetylmuramic acid kinase
MSSNATKLYEIANKKSRNIIGLMSGTSLDGLDIALVNIEAFGSDTKCKSINFKTVNYSDEEREKINKIFTKSMIDLQYLTVLNEWIGRLHGDMINATLAEWGIDYREIDLIASHGQTIYHAPNSLHQLKDFNFDATLQIGDGDHIAVTTGIITLADFRQKHIAKGGEGAPLALYGDCILLSDPVRQRILLNLGGISNYTYIPNQLSTFIAEASDIGPGNTLIDLLSKKFYNLSYDNDGAIGKSGFLNQALLDSMIEDEFFDLPYPKSTGQEYFNEKWLDSHVQKICPSISNDDLMCTVTHLTANSIAICLNDLMAKYGPCDLFISGGGALNKFLVELFHQYIPNTKIAFSDELGVPYDAKEAILFAVLANECLCNPDPSYKLIQKYGDFTMGKVCFPN